ncbi:HB21 protein, partial [Xiphorhynchus elegans]|nr:HB21 protein [Xiphorhynchus elegans]
GTNPDLSPAHTEVLQIIANDECHFINGTDRVRLLERYFKYFYNREQFVHFDSDVGHFVGDTPFGEIQARNWNNDPEWMELKRAEID